MGIGIGRGRGRGSAALSLSRLCNNTTATWDSSSTVLSQPQRSCRASSMHVPGSVRVRWEPKTHEMDITRSRCIYIYTPGFDATPVSDREHKRFCPPSTRRQTSSTLASQTSTSLPNQRAGPGPTNAPPTEMAMGPPIDFQRHGDDVCATLSTMQHCTLHTA